MEDRRNDPWLRHPWILVVIFMRAVNCSTVHQIRVTGNRWTTNERRALLSTRAALFSIARNPKIASPLRWLMYRIPAHPSNSIHYRRPRIFHSLFLSLFLSNSNSAPRWTIIAFLSFPIIELEFLFELRISFMRVEQISLVWNMRGNIEITKILF